MRATNIPDKIDFEISKTYFRTASNNRNKTQSPDDIRRLLQQNHFKKIAKKNDAKKIPPKKQSGNISQFVPFFLIIIVAAGIFSSVTWLIKQKHVTFTVNIKIGNSKDNNLQADNSLVETTVPEQVKPITEPLLSKNGNSAFVVAIPYNRDNTPKHVFSPDKTLYDFENDLNGWEIPYWEREKTDHVAKTLKKTSYIAYSGTGSLELSAEFPKKPWTAALVEIQQYLDLTNYNFLSANVYLPLRGPEAEIRGKLIFTAREDWDFIEMNRSVRLIPGKWVTLTASIAEGSKDWGELTLDEKITSDIRKISVRIESYNTPYSGPIYIDNIQALSSSR